MPYGTTGRSGIKRKGQSGYRFQGLRINTMSYYYLASPYSKHPRGRHVAFKRVCEATKLLIQHNVPVFSPIAHTHSLAETTGLDGDHDFWMNVDAPMMEAALGLIVLMDEGWEESRGVSEEIATFLYEHKPVFYMEPGLVPMYLDVIFNEDDEE